jgi:ribosome-associated protein
MKIFIPFDRLTFKSTRSSGPGGQGVNKTESKVELRFHVLEADWIPPATKHRFSKLFSARINNEGELILSSEIHRSRKQNQEACLSKLASMLEEAQKIPKKRIKTKATRSSQRKRVESKKKRGAVKTNRQKKFSDD